MKPFKVVFDAPWPVIEGQARCEAIFRATNITRALEVATAHGTVRAIGLSMDMPVIDDPRSGATQVGQGAGE